MIDRMLAFFGVQSEAGFDLNVLSLTIAVSSLNSGNKTLIILDDCHSFSHLQLVVSFKAGNVPYSESRNPE